MAVKNSQNTNNKKNSAAKTEVPAKNILHLFRSEKQFRCNKLIKTTILWDLQYSASERGKSHIKNITLNTQLQTKRKAIWKDI
jgi:hypothetical protein